MHINDLNNKWIKKGQEVSDLNDKLNKMVMNDSFNEDDYKKTTENRNNAKSQRDALKSQLDEARENDKPSGNTEGKSNDDGKPHKVNDKNKVNFVDKFKGMLRGDPKVVDEVTSVTDPSSPDNSSLGLTVPSDDQKQINQLTRQYDALDQYVNVENVGTSKGSRIYEKMSAIKPLNNLSQENIKIPSMDDPEVNRIEYTIQRFGGISSLTNTVMADSADNLMQYINNWIAKKDVITRNNEILKVIGTAPKKSGINSFDDVKRTIETAVDPAIVNTSTIFTNQSGFTALATVKDANGNYLVQNNVTNPAQKEIDGKPICVISDRWLQDNGGAHPFIYGDLKQGITLFDRQQMTLNSTNDGAGGFESDTTKVKVIDRFDVELTDFDAFTVDSFTDLPDQGTKNTTSNSKAD
ncbi:phage major capsid protein [Fructilactobacillus fructivorans]|uniref:Phage major capsid protein n=1 Tax=Fructilactobacillus fructivorans TaxID=1614 RepID=A0AAE6P196_9LACO|nr:phage major capsid protein [Fructilactobacillus fructivorans]KRK58498.1 HK97 family phage major capsid protein [Fructilactobacillus fructivorans]QFX92508.1 phage major capsid protein [Fructilactobacillus fructivorans]RDV65897.1 phage major capsid protein [Fructilactobacillus fructivorans]